MTEVLLLLIALLLVAACGAFVAAEFSFITVDRSSIERAAADGDVDGAATAADPGRIRARRSTGDFGHVSEAFGKGSVLFGRAQCRPRVVSPPGDNAVAVPATG